MVMALVEWIRKLFQLIHLMIFRDLICAILFFWFQIKIRWIIWRKKVLIKFFDENVQKHPDKIALIYNNERYTFKDVHDFAQKISNWIESSLQLGHDDDYERQFAPASAPQQQKRKDREAKLLNKFEQNSRSTQIGLMFGNIPELPCFILGIARVRCSSVLFNTNHRRDTLINAFRTTNCKVFIFEAKFLDTIKDVADQLPDIRFFMFDRKESKNITVDPYYQGFSREELADLNGSELNKAMKFASILNAYPITPLLKHYPYQFTDMIHYLFTSGTTGGNIKSVPMDNIRYVGINLSQNLVFGLKRSDHFYVCLPCYHAFAGSIGIGSMFITGCTVTLAEKFSASKFWKECRQNGCDIALYIGEICRYLLAQPEHPDETKHSLRMMLGIGLNKENWSQMTKRFKIPKICEYYASTEGNILIANHQNVEGSCGFLPYYYGILLRTLWPCHLIKVDRETLELCRYKKSGLCKFARNGDLGMMVGEIRPEQIFTQYLGYTSPEESAKKVVRNVRKHGDFVFVSGDLMEMDFFGNLYFKDRTGDTFRWKGENVSTTEIETIVAPYLNYKDSVVYGVQVPHCEGRAGMLAITDRKVDLDKLYHFMKQRIPDYAIPKFIRITDHIPTTSTHKYIKYSLREDGFNLERIKTGDSVFYFDRSCSKYLPLDQHAYHCIQTGIIQF